MRSATDLIKYYVMLYYHRVFAYRSVISSLLLVRSTSSYVYHQILRRQSHHTLYLHRFSL